MKKILLFSLSFVLVLTLTGCGLKQNQPVVTPPAKNTNTNATTNTNQTPLEGNVTISMRDLAFDPTTATVKKGTIVTWENHDNASHQVVADATPVTVYTNSLRTNVMAPGQSWSFTFDEPGTYNYHCSLHPTMKGSIIVIE